MQTLGRGEEEQGQHARANFVGREQLSDAVRFIVPLLLTPTKCAALILCTRRQGLEGRWQLSYLVAGNLEGWTFHSYKAAVR